MTKTKANQLTVSELIELLRALPPDMLVENQGCDCRVKCIGAFVDNCDPYLGHREMFEVVVIDGDRS